MTTSRTGTPSAKNLVEARNLTVGYAGRPVLQGIEFTIGRGSYIGIIGPNGGGKTTLLRTILGLLPVVAGKLVIANGPGHPVRFGYVPQRETFDTLFPLTGREVATMGRYPRIGVGRRTRRHDRDFVAEILRLMGVDEVADQAFRDLSGGQKQRILISRALAGEPDALILDEPTASMDVRGEREVMDLLATLRSDRGITIIMVSHFLTNLRGHVDRVLICDRDGDGFAEGDPDSVLSTEGIAHLFSGSPRHGERD